MNRPPASVASRLARENARKARKVLGWKPRISFKALVRDMVESDLDVMRREGVQNERV